MNKQSMWFIRIVWLLVGVNVGAWIDFGGAETNRADVCEYQMEVQK